jgi:hypothetical protein
MKSFIINGLFLFTVLNANTSIAASSFSHKEDTTIIVPNGKWIKGKRVQPYHQLFVSYSITNGQEVKTGSVDDTYQFIKIKNKKYGLRIARIILPGREILDSGLVDISTLKPVYHHSHQTTKTMLLNFDGKKIKGTIATNQRIDTVNAGYSHPLFDSYYETLIARTIELKDGFVFKYPDYIYEEGGLVWQSGKVEKISDSPFGKDVWSISYIDSGSGRKTTYWIDKERKLIRLQYQFGDKLSIQKPE